MENSTPTLELRVQAGGDIIREEQLARALRAEIEKTRGAEVRIAPSGPGLDGAKGSSVGGADLWVFLAATAAPLGTALVTLIKEWSKTKRATVRFRIDGLELEMPSGTDEAQERMLARLLDKRHQ
ncbi:hypothetical protein [Amycolatopsis rubida]|uniref:Uncharacterized protein n=1 Tax=Amycolatopsis rubida TaxID=112413 RepID=A0A1I5W895_9PSEU|nr:hypothetical protein [Amycolatopsis rubida]SFQ15972.1 hypothetical protein SAMN05421854_109107 [Amycolatopsis rubida]